MKIVKNSEARLVTNLRLGRNKNAEEKNAKQKMWNERMQIYPKFKIFNFAFFEYNTHHFLLNLQLFKLF